MLDPSTGLPEAPKGCYFEVKYPADLNLLRTGWWGGPLPLDKSKLVLSLMHEGETWETVRYVRRWWQLKKREIRTPEKNPDRELTSVPVQGYHPIAVRNAAYRVLKKYKARQDREDLLGKYPPKKLEVPNA